MGLPPLVIFQQMNSGMNVFTLLAVPFFIYAGDLMVRGGIAQRIVAFAGSLVGHLRGGLGQVNIAASTLFGGISGSAVAEAAAVGGLMIPQMKARGYRRRLCGQRHLDGGADRAAAAAQPQHDHLFDLGRREDFDRRPVHRRHHPGPAAGAVADGHRLYRRAPARLSDRSRSPASARSGSSSLVSLPGLLLIAIIFGGVRSGIFTATESSCIAVFYALLVTILVYRQMSWKDFVARDARRGAHHRRWCCSSSAPLRRSPG